MTATPRRGRPRTAINPAKLASLPPVARVLLAAGESVPAEQREEVRRNCRGLNPTVASVARALTILRPKDADGGWGWFGRELAKTNR